MLFQYISGSWCSVYEKVIKGGGTSTGYFWFCREPWTTTDSNIQDLKSSLHRNVKFSNRKDDGKKWHCLLYCIYVLTFLILFSKTFIGCIKSLHFWNDLVEKDSKVGNSVFPRSSREVREEVRGSRSFSDTQQIGKQYGIYKILFQKTGWSVSRG